MKNRYIIIISLLAILVFSDAISQEVDLEINGYTQIYQLENMDQELIHGNLFEWVAMNYKSAQDVIQMNTKDKIITKGNFTINVIYPMYVVLEGYKDVPVEITIDHTLMISIKEDRYKVDLLLPEEVKTMTLLETDIFASIGEPELYKKYTLEYVQNEYLESCQECTTEKKIQKFLKRKKKKIQSRLKFKTDFSNALSERVLQLYRSIETSANKQDSW